LLCSVCGCAFVVGVVVVAGCDDGVDVVVVVIDYDDGVVGCGADVVVCVIIGIMMLLMMLILLV